jgi:DNA (cytosine-5)-methyltransferase 1
MHQTIAAIDLFCGVGGLTHGLESSGINVVGGIDIDETCRYAYESNNNSKFICADIENISGEFVSRLYPEKAIKVLAGCAPCQPYSALRAKRYSQPPEEKQLESFIRLIKEVVPDIVTMENVVNLRSRKIYQKFLQTLKKMKYSIWENSVNAADYGVPQSRRRLVLLASMIGPISMIEHTHTKENYISVKEAIGDLPPLEAGETSPRDPMHRARGLSDLNLKRIKASKPEGTWTDWDDELKLKCHLKDSGKSFKAVYGRMSWGKLSPTITTKFHNLGSGRFGHPSQDRAITPREAAILQTFPASYKFVEGDKPVVLENAGRWIGNAVPVKLAENIGLSIIDCVEKNKEKDKRIH